MSNIILINSFSHKKVLFAKIKVLFAKRSTLRENESFTHFRVTLQVCPSYYYYIYYYYYYYYYYYNYYYYYYHLGPKITYNWVRAELHHLKSRQLNNGFHQYTKPLGALQHLQVYDAEPATLSGLILIQSVCLAQGHNTPPWMVLEASASSFYI